MEILYRRSALLNVDRYDEFRRKCGYEPMGHEILAAIAVRLQAVRTWEEIAAPVYRVRNEVLPVKRLLVPVRSKQFKAYVRLGPEPGIIAVTHIRHPAQRPIE